MDMRSRFCVDFLLVFILFSLINENKTERVRLRGVQTSLLSMYIPSKPFTCLDGSLTIPFELVNDDYCDCRDGTDEPGTSACANGRFFCENKGFVGSLIPSYAVGDGICDCCDGSDEYENKVICNNTCFELSQKAQAERETKRQLHEKGVAKKKEIIGKANQLKTERKIQLEELEKSLSTLQEELKSKEEIKNQVEVSENGAKEKYEQRCEEERVRHEAQVHDRRLREIFTDLDTDQNSLVSVAELQIHTELDPDPSNEFTVEEARSILSQDSVNLNDFNETVFDQISNSYKKRNENTSSSPTSLEHEKHWHDDYVKPDYDEETKKIIEQADQARHNFNEIQTKMNDAERQIEDLKKQSGVDIGPNGEFGAFLDQCFDFHEREYTYRVCMFKDAKQISKDSSNEVVIGYWDSWTGPKTNKYESMRYNKGATCWNGPARSLSLKFQCGLEHRILDVREPSRCEYSMLFETPSACDEILASNPSHYDHVEF